MFSFFLEVFILRKAAAGYLLIVWLGHCKKGSWKNFGSTYLGAELCLKINCVWCANAAGFTLPGFLCHGKGTKCRILAICCHPGMEPHVCQGGFVNGNCRIVFGVNSLGNGGSDIGEKLAVSVCAG